MKITKNLLGAFIVSALFFVGTAHADQTGDCTAGDQYCEQNCHNHDHIHRNIYELLLYSQPQPRRHLQQ